MAASGVCLGVPQENSGKVPHCLDLVPTFCVGYFLKSTVPTFSSFSDFRSEKNTERKKHVNRIFAGLSRDFGGDFVYVFFSLPQKE